MAGARGTVGSVTVEDDVVVEESSISGALAVSVAGIIGAVAMLDC